MLPRLHHQSALFLASAATTMITGDSLKVDGAIIIKKIPFRQAILAPPSPPCQERVIARHATPRRACEF